MLSRKKIIFSLVLGLIYLFYASKINASENKITIGLFIPANGPDVQSGNDVIEGARIAIKQANSKNGIYGRLLRLSIASSDSAWNTAAGGLVKLIHEEDAVAVIGALDGQTAHLAEQIITRSHGKAVFITLWATEDSLTQIRIPWFFRMVPNDRQQAQTLSKEIFSHRKVKHIAASVDNSFDSKAEFESFIRYSPLNRVTRFNIDKVEDKIKLTEGIKAGKYNSLALFLSPQKAANLAVELGRNGYHINLYGNTKLSVSPFIDLPDKYTEGTILISPGIIEDSILTKKFKDTFEKKNKRAPSPLAFYSYDAVSILIKALHRMHKKMESLRVSIINSSITGTTGRVQFNDKGERNIDTSLSILKGGKLIPNPDIPKIQN